MDAYLAAGELKNASNFYLNINFEVLNGCNLRCPGCHVEKNSQESFSEREFQKLEHLLNDFSQRSYLPFIAFIGPTDFLSSENFTDLFSQKKMIKLMHYFKRISLQTTYLDLKNLSKTVEVLREHYSDLELEINIVVDPAKIMDDRYLEIISTNKEKFLKSIQRNDVRTFGIMNVYDYDKTKIPELLKDYDFMHGRVAHLFETTIDYNFSFGRNAKISNQEFVELCNRVKNLFNDALISAEKNSYLRFSFGKLTDSLIEKQFNYRNGKIYFSPLLYERFVSFRNEFEVPMTNFTSIEIEEYETKILLEQYSLAEAMEECGSCPFVASCIDRGILKLMDIYQTKKCLVAKKALMSVNSNLLGVISHV